MAAAPVSRHLRSHGALSKLVRARRLTMLAHAGAAMPLSESSLGSRVFIAARAVGPARGGGSRTGPRRPSATGRVSVPSMIRPRIDV